MKGARDLRKYSPDFPVTTRRQERQALALLGLLYAVVLFDVVAALVLVLSGAKP